jgi:hypothetical protein
MVCWYESMKGPSGGVKRLVPGSGRITDKPEAAVRASNRPVTALSGNSNSLIGDSDRLLDTLLAKSTEITDMSLFPYCVPSDFADVRPCDYFASGIVLSCVNFAILYFGEVKVRNKTENQTCHPNIG